jgi:hypothetical protein
MQPQPARRPEQVAPDAANESNVLNTRLAVGIFDSLDQARTAWRDLEAAGYAAQDISVVAKNEGAAPHLGAEETHAQHGTAAGAGIGAILGGAAGLAALAIPGIGPLLAAGPIVAAISGALAGGSIGGLVGSFVGLGVPTQHAEEYERAVRAGGVVVAVRAPTHTAADHAAHILRQQQARDVTTFTAEM